MKPCKLCNGTGRIREEAEHDIKHEDGTVTTETLVNYRFCGCTPQPATVNTHPAGDFAGDTAEGPSSTPFWQTDLALEYE